MTSKEQDDLVLDEATQQGQQIEYSNNYDYAGEAAAAEGESSTNENKWNKNGFGQGKLLKFSWDACGFQFRREPRK